MKKILIPTDFSKKSQEVISFALEAFDDEVSEFYFIHTYIYQKLGLDALSILHGSKEYFDEIDLKLYEKMVKQVGSFVNQPKYVKHRFKILCKNSEFLLGIKQAVIKLEIDIVIIGTEGEDLKTKQYKEQKVNLLINEIKSCPVMAVPLNGEAWKSMGLEVIKLAS